MEEAAKPPGDGSADGLPVSARQEQFSVAFVRMVAAAAGCSVKVHDTDYDGVDITVVHSAEYSVYYLPELELQLKCTTQTRYLADDHMAWPMKAKPFAKLTNPKRFTPAYLGVLVIPNDPTGLLAQDETRLLTESRMYWQRADNLGTIEDEHGSKTVHLPRSNLFDVPQLLGIMATIGNGGDW